MPVVSPCYGILFGGDASRPYKEGIKGGHHAEAAQGEAQEQARLLRGGRTVPRPSPFDHEHPRQGEAVFFDNQEATLTVGGLLAFPDFCYAAPARADVKEIVVLGGSNSSASVSITGSAEDS
jgi:hypothetical protein